MTLYDKVHKMNSIYGIWRYTNRLRITYVSQGWFVVWDHATIPPIRYDCHGNDHDAACHAVVEKVREIGSY